MLHRITEMRGFLRACQMTDYMLPDQITLISLALAVLEAYIKVASPEECAALEAALEAREQQYMKEA